MDRDIDGENSSVDLGKRQEYMLVQAWKESDEIDWRYPAKVLVGGWLKGKSSWSAKTTDLNKSR